MTRQRGAEREDLARDLAARLEGEVRSDPVSRFLYATDASVYQDEPILVAIPRHAGDLQAILQVARERGVPVLPRGGGTSLEGQTTNRAIQIDCVPHLHRILEIDPEARRARVQPGVVLEDLNSALAPHGLQFGPDVATADRATLGGMIGNNSSGARSLVYGKTVDHVLALEVLLADGASLRLEERSGPALRELLGQEGREAALHREVVGLARRLAPRVLERFPRILRRVSGYNLDELLRGLVAAGIEGVPPWPGEVAPLARRPEGFSLAPVVVGSEGTLAVTAEATLNLVPRPEAVGLLVGQFRSRDEALEANLSLLELQPLASELMDRELLELARRQREMSRHLGFLEGDPGALLVVEFGGAAAALPGRLEHARQHLLARGLGAGHLALTDPARMADVWKVRRAGLPLLLGIQGRRKPIAFVEDTAVSPDRLLEFVERFDEIMEAHGTRAAYYAHASVGCLHIRPLLDLKCAEDVGRMASISEAVTDLVTGMGGALSGEHGDGKAHSWWHPRIFGEELYEGFRQLKAAFDPAHLLNPGDIVDAPPITEHLRFGPGYRVELPVLQVDWSAEGGLDEAVELCNGAGVCRKTRAGTMCPSYMVTRDEEHSTRGRANALRGALSGQLPPDSLTSDRMQEVMDLCLSCKACKAECPSNVDMAKIKIEVMAQRYRRHGVPWRARLFASVDRLNRWGSALAPLSNAVLQGPLWPGLARGLGLAPARRLPRFAREPFELWWRRRPPRPAGGRGRPRVALFVDTFAQDNEPEVARAAVTVLEAAGLSVEPVQRVCCGRPALSKGLVGPAREAARRLVARLAPLAEAGIPVVGLEPSCLLTLRDEARWLAPGPATEAVASSCWTFEEFVAGLDLPLGPGPTEILLHGHCHQKALVGMAPSLAALGKVPGLAVRELDAGCCGMAGSFGYEAEHYRISQAIGERRLLPEARAARARGVEVVAAGTSCRHQLADGAGAPGLHPAQLLAACLAPGRAR